MNPGPEGRHALVVATARYGDPKLRQLRAPAVDAARLAAVLSDPAKGDFDVDVVLDKSHAEVTRRIASFFRDRGLQDLLLLHFSCHGIKDERGELYLAAADTEVDLLSATGVSAAWLNDQISRTRSRRTVVLLDCCFSGSFPFGMRGRGSGVDAPEQLQGRGRVIITASNALEYAYEGDELTGEGQPSIFTAAVVEGLETGKADLDGDRLVSVDDLYNYVYDRVKDATPHQTPSKKSELEGPLYLARSSYRPEVTPAQLDPELLARTDDRYAGIREGAVQELAGLLVSRDEGVVLAARNALARMVEDDSRRVSTAARAALSEERPAPDPVPSPERRSGTPPWRGRLAAAAAVVLVAGAVAVAVVVLAGHDDGGQTASVVPAGNLTANPSFERGDTSGWGNSYHAKPATERAADAPDGERVARVALIGAPDEYSIDDDPESVKSSVKGRAYIAAAWVKATPTTAGRPICIALREARPGADDGSYVLVAQGMLTLSADRYRKLQVTLVAAADKDMIGVHVFRYPGGVRAREAFLVDAISITPGPSGDRNTQLVREAKCQSTNTAA